MLLGLITALVGVAAVIVGAALGNDESGAGVVVVQSVGGGEPTPSSTSTSPPRSTSPPTTSVAVTASTSTSTSVPATPTSPTTQLARSASDVGSFVDEVGLWIAQGDATSLLDNLHPEVRDRFGEDLCQAWIGREILALSDYRVTGAPTGPTAVSIQTPTEPFDLDESWIVPVSFTFQGQMLESSAQVGVVDGGLVWLGQCR